MARREAGIKPWRKTVRRAMRAAARREARRRSGAAGKAAFNYRWEHVKAVVRLARRLATLTGADLEVVEAAAWLHDVTKMDGENHPSSGASFARKLLPTTDFPPEKIRLVARTIADHRGLYRHKPLKRLESQVLWDADKLSKLGLTGSIHLSGMLLQNGSLTTRELIAAMQQADWPAKTVASMHTEPARRAARARLKAYRELWAGLAAELDGEDL